MLRFIIISTARRETDLNFNTSHVTVYQANELVEEILWEFQYISCYGLSIQVLYLRLPRNYFNTSHVTVYHMKVNGIDIRK